MAYGKFLAPLNGRVIQQQIEKPYVDDIFDPLFNREVTEYYRGLYGPLGGIGAGYAAMLDNALTGHKGILGPGMGILSTFGRSMDKADDFILGGLTEGVNALGQITGGTNEAPQNPFERIFVDDYDYQGTKLMAAAGNAMARLAGTQTPLDETDFQSIGDKIAGTTIDLATDPGIMGGNLARLNPNTPVGQVGHLLDEYDNMVANVAGNMAFPGGKAMLGKGLNKINQILSSASEVALADYVTKHTKVINPYTGATYSTSLSPDSLATLKHMSDDFVTHSKLEPGEFNPIDNPDLYAIKENIDFLTNFVDEDSYAKAIQEYTEKQNKILEIRERYAKQLKDTADSHRETIFKSSMEGMKKHHLDFKKGEVINADVNPVVTIFDKQYNEHQKYLNDLTEQELRDYVIDTFGVNGDIDYYGKPIEHGKFYSHIDYVLKEHGLDAAKSEVVYKLNPEVKDTAQSAIVFAPDKMGFQSKFSKESLQLINHHIKTFLHKHPEGLNKTYLKKELGEGSYIPKNIFEILVKYSKGDLVEYDKITKSKVFNGRKYQELLNALYNRDLKYAADGIETVTEQFPTQSLIPWIKANTHVLQKTQVGRDLIELANNLEKDIFDNTLYDFARKSMSVDEVATYNDEFLQKTFSTEGYNRVAQTYTDVYNPVKLLNQYLSKQNFSPEDLEAYAKDFPYLDIKVSESYIKNSPQYAAWMEKRKPILDKIRQEQELRSEILRIKEWLKEPDMPQELLDYYNRAYKSLVQKYKKLNPNMKPEAWVTQQTRLLNSIGKRAPTELEEMLEKYYIPAKKKYWKEVRGTPYAYDYMSITPVNLYDASKKMLTVPKKDDYIKLSDSLATFTAKDFATTVTNNFSFQDTVILDDYNKIFNDFKMGWDLPGDMPPSDLEFYIKNYGSVQEKTLFQQINAAISTKVRNKLKTDHGALYVAIVEKSAKLARHLMENNKFAAAQIEEYISRQDLAEGVTILGNNFLESIWASQGFKEFPVPPKMTKETADAISAALKRNVDAVNQHGSILKFVDTVGEDKVRRIAVFFDTDNLNIKKDINKLYGLFGKKDLGLQDVTLRNAVQSRTKFDSTELDTLFNEIRQGTEVLGTTLGYTKFSPNYITHAMVDDKLVAEEFSHIYKTLGIDKDKLNSICEALQQQDIASGKLAFGSIPMERSHLGYFGQYKTKNGTNMFSTDLNKIHSSTFTKGMFDNTNAQTFFELFLTDNFKLKNNFDDWQTLKQALNASEGNLTNLTIVKPRYESGRLVGFTKFDKLSDTGLQKAFNDDEAILVPDEVLGILDRLCKKDARMSSRVYRFINKYLTVPYKFGTLANPGFLAGNIQDAYLKQAMTLSKKYGTSVSEELTNVAFSMRQVFQLNNNFTEIFEGYRKWLKDTNLDTITISTKPEGWYTNTFKKSKNMVDTLTIDQIVGNPELYKAFREYLNIHVSENQYKIANLYLYLNNRQTTDMFKNNNRDMENLADLTTTNPYATPNNIIERIMYGNPSKTKFVKINGEIREIQDRGFNSYGLFLNNPVSNAILKSSNTIENLMRSSTILNDLQHQGYTLEDICNILGTDIALEKGLRDKFNISMTEAMNTMNAANFDYDTSSELMNKMSYILPFPTFYLKNLAFWANVFVNNPQYVDNIISVHENLWSGKDTSDEFTAEAKGRGAVPIGQQGNKHLTGIVKQTPYNSMFGAFNAVNNAPEDFAYRINPIARPITRHLQDEKNIKYRPYNTNPYQKNIKYGDKEFSELSYMFHQLNPYERVASTLPRTPSKIANNTWQLSDFLPSIFQPDFNKKSKK